MSAVIEEVEVEEPVDCTYSFAELSDAAKEAARERHRGEGYLDYDWWDSVYDDAVECGRLLGIQIGTLSNTHPNGRESHQPDISFSGFSSQGDGASFVGRYRPPENMLAVLQHAPEDTELARIAQALASRQMATKLVDNDQLVANITGRNTTHYSHSGTMNVEVTWQDQETNGFDSGTDRAVTDEEEKDITQLMRDFADWIYDMLEKEHDWLMSDECVDEYLSDLTFDDEGGLV